MWYKNGTVYNNQQSIRNDNPNSSLPHFLSDSVIEELGYQMVVVTEQPTHTEVQYVQDSGVQVIDGVPTQTWSVVDMFQDTTEYVDMDGNVVPAMTKAEHEAKYLADKAKALVPQSITPRQARLVLLQYNLLDDIEAMIATDRELGIWWEYSLDIKRDDARLIASATALNITLEQLDQMFIEASVM